MSAHTPGPWTVGYLRIEGRADIYADSESTSIASVREANAALVAAAPELLEALTKCDRAFAAWQVGQIPGRPEEILALIVEVRAAIAKAEGES